MDFTWSMPQDLSDIYYFDIVMNNIDQIDDIQKEIDFFCKKEMYRECAILKNEIEKRKISPSLPNQ